MSGQFCNFCTQWWSSRPTYHNGPCPARARQEKRMAEKTKTKAAKAKDLIGQVNESYAAAHRSRHRAESVLMELEDREARRASRREARSRDNRR